MGFLNRRGPEMCTFGVLGLSCETPAAPGVGGVQERVVRVGGPEGWEPRMVGMTVVLVLSVSVCLGVCWCVGVCVGLCLCWCVSVCVGVLVCEMTHFMTSVFLSQKIMVTKIKHTKEGSPHCAKKEC